MIPLLPFVVVTAGLTVAFIGGVVLGLMWAEDQGAEESRPQPAPHAVASSSNIVQLFERVEA